MNSQIISIHESSDFWNRVEQRSIFFKYIKQSFKTDIYSYMNKVYISANDQNAFLDQDAVDSIACFIDSCWWDNKESDFYPLRPRHIKYNSVPYGYMTSVQYGRIKIAYEWAKKMYNFTDNPKEKYQQLVKSNLTDTTLEGDWHWHMNRNMALQIAAAFLDAGQRLDAKDKIEPDMLFNIPVLYNIWMPDDICLLVPTSKYMQMNYAEDILRNIDNPTRTVYEMILKPELLENSPFIVIYNHGSPKHPGY